MSVQEILGNIKDAMSGNTDKPVELKETQGKLTELKSAIELKNGVEIDPFLNDKLRPSFIKDLIEAGITDAAKQAELWGLTVQEVKDHLVLDSKEKMELDAFLEHESNLPKLKEYANGGDSVERLKKAVEKIPGIGWLLAGSLGDIFAGMAKDSKSSFLKPLWEKLALAFGKKEKTPQELAKEKDKPLIDAFTKNGFTEATATTVISALAVKNVVLDQSKLEADIQLLKAQKWDDKTITETLPKTLADNGKLGKILKEIYSKKGLAESTITIPFRFLHFENFNPEKITTLVTTLNGESKEYEITNKTVAGCIEFLDVALMGGEKLEDSIFKYKKAAPAAAVAAAPVAPVPAPAPVAPVAPTKTTAKPAPVAPTAVAAAPKQ